MSGQPEYIDVTREITIKSDPETIAAQVVDFGNWRNWSPWEGLDPDLKRTYSGPTNGVGATYEWSGNRKAGTGRMRITKVEPHEILIDLTFLKPFKSDSKTVFEFAPVEGGTTLTWTVKTPKTLTTKLFGLFMNFEKMVGTDLENGLASLQQVAEGTE